MPFSLCNDLGEGLLRRVFVSVDASEDLKNTNVASVATNASLRRSITLHFKFP